MDSVFDGQAGCRPEEAGIMTRIKIEPWEKQAIKEGPKLLVTPTDDRITYWVDTGFACGAVDVWGDRIVDSCSIFKRWIGSSWPAFKSHYKNVKVEAL